ncbi:MAG TPA: riboflavin synthase [Trebonia sp.]|jgi:riboflavin synthase
MFTGIVEDLGEVEAIEHLGDSARIHVRSAKVSQDASPGDSIAVNGVCLTVTGFLDGRPDGGRPDGGRPDGGQSDGGQSAPRGFVADVMGETLRLTSLKDIAPGTRVNLERSVKLEDRLGGHLVQGHVDGTGTILGRDPQEHWEVVRISLPGDIGKYVAHKGSITVDGISLTVSAISESWFEVSLIPETLKRTTLGFKQVHEAVNLEVDVIAKYVEKLLGGNR